MLDLSGVVIHFYILGELDTVSTKEYKKRNELLQEKVISEIEKAKRGESTKNVLQLQGILNELQSSNNKKNLSLYYPHVIVDSWDFTDELEAELLELAEMYGKIKE